MLRAHCTLFRCLLVLFALSHVVCAGPSNTVHLTSTPNPSVFGAPVTLTATVDSGATGRITFYDGVSILGTSSISNGSAVLTTSFLPGGAGALRAWYSGDSSNPAASSNVLSQMVNTVPAGAMQAAVNYTVGTSPSAIAMGDFKGNGGASLAIANQGSNNVSVLLGNGDGTFAPAVNYAVGSAPAAIATGDFNGDGSTDLAVANSSDGTVSILLGNGDGTFQTASAFQAGTGPVSIAVADFNGDGIPDLVVANAGSNNISVLLGKGDGTFRTAVNYPADQQPVSLAVADFNVDGSADLAVVNKTSGDYSILLGKGDGTFQAAVNHPLVSNQYTVSYAFVAVGDFNSDGIPDLAIATATNYGYNFPTILTGAGDGTFAAAASIAVSDVPVGLIAGDFNGDGNPDVAVLDRGESNGVGPGITLDFGVGGATFAAYVQVSSPPTAFPAAFLAGDFNGDGRTDFAVVNSGTGNVSIFLAGTPPAMSCDPADLSVNITDPAQDVVAEFCDVNSAPSGITLLTSTAPSAINGAWVTPTLEAQTTPTLLEVYEGGLSNWAAGTHNEAIDLWDQASGFHLRVPANLTISSSVCTYNLTPASLFAATYGASGVITVQINHACGAPTVSSDSSWLTFLLNPPGYGGFTIGYTVASNTGMSRTGHLTVGSQSFTVTQYGPLQSSPGPVSVSPANGSGSSQTFQFVYSDSGGAADLTAEVWFTQSPGTDYSTTCKLYYVAATNQLHLVDDTGLSELTGALGTAGTLQNHQCGIDAGNATASWSGNTFTLTLPMTFTAVLEGGEGVWMHALGVNTGSAWNQEGSWTVTAPPDTVSVVSTKPCCGTGLSQTFTFTYADSSGGQKIQTSGVWFTPSASNGSAATCMIAFSPTSNQWSLLNDAGAAWINGSYGMTLQNSQCSFLPTSTYGYNGNQFFWSVTVTFNAAFGGVKQIWMNAAESATNTTGWQQYGTWTVTSQLQIVSLNPASGSGVHQIFQVTLSDPTVDAYYLQSVDLLINSSLSPANACYVHLTKQGVYLRSDDGTQWLSPPQNAQCSVALSESYLGFVTTVLVEFKPGFSGIKTVYSAASDTNTSLALQPFGTYTVLPQTPAVPQVVSASPASGYGTGPSITFTFYDPLSIGDLSSVNVLFNSTSTSFANACYISINPTTQTVQLANDSGVGWLQTLQNSQCMISLYQISGQRTGDTLTVALDIGFLPAFSGNTNLYAEANSLTGTSSGWQLLGTWGTYIPVPSNVSVSPASGGGHTQTFTFTSSYVEGGSSITTVTMLFGTPGSNLYDTNIPDVCIVFYDVQLNSLTLLDDTGTYGTGVGAPGSPGHANNSQCRLDLAHSTAVVSGNNLVIQLALTFSYDYQGSQGIWMNTIDGVDDTGTSLTRMGTWTVPPSPVTFTVSPAPATFGQPVTLTASLKAGGGTGTMTFFDRSTIVGSAVMAGGTAAFRTITLPAGSHKLIAYYSGDSSNPSGQSATVAETVNTVPWTQLTAVAPVAAGATPTSMAVGDFNGDGRADLVVANQSAGTVSILLGHGDGTFDAPAWYSTGAGVAAVVIGDFNRDGFSDLAVGTAAGVSILLGNGDGTFQAAVSYPAGSGGASSLAIADFNGDGIADLAVGSLGTSTILPGKGDGTFGPPVTVNVVSASWLGALDYNNDGDVDLWVLPASGTGTLALAGNGDFTFRPAATLPTLSNTPTAGLVADVTGSGNPGLVVATEASAGNLLVLPQSGGGGTPLLQGQLTIPVVASALAASDFNGDGTPDLAAVGSNGTAAALEILLGTGAAAFHQPVNYPVGAAQAALALGDFDGDGRTDIALANYNDGTVSILLGAAPNDAAPVLSAAKTHSGALILGQAAASYSITVSNGGPATSAAVTVTEIPPQGVSIESMTGTGWACGNPANTCTRSYPLAQWGSYPPITVTASIAPNAPSLLVNQVSVSGGGSATVTTNDPATATAPSPCDFTSIGSTTLADLQEIINEALGNVQAKHDLGNSGWVTVTDIQSVLNAALGMPCIIAAR
ncbi:MAG TPA: FG-GAP-like repeat-containing protein [Bryobacteraceae bacterium]|nr:FG-GAP-like repeat-containing protein [Bryobacteraceae bacterium]